MRWVKSKTARWVGNRALEAVPDEFECPQEASFEDDQSPFQVTLNEGDLTFEGPMGVTLDLRLSLREPKPHQ